MCADETLFLAKGESTVFHQTDQDLNIELKTHGFELPANQYERIEQCLGSLREAVDRFPVKTLNVTANFHGRPSDYHVKMSLMLPGRTLFTGERDREVHVAMERCAEKLLRKVNAYKRNLDSEEEKSKQAAGTHHVVDSSMEIDTAELEAARDQHDYARFRKGLDGFTASLTERIGRWVQRYPEVEAALGEGITISDLVEDVFFHAYDQFDDRKQDVPPGDWLEGLVDQSIQDFLRSPETELANISYASHRLEQRAR
jgi:ribosome-associated translation inhibitor RaiA